jgi:Calcineurin-like phosphoesterase
MAGRIGATPVRYPFSFIIVGDSGAWADPTADGIYRQLLRQTARLTPAPVFLANLGDFAGPGTRERHQHYLELVRDLPFPDLCVVGNHDLDDPGALEAWGRVHGPTNLSFAYGHTRFVAINSGAAVETPQGTEGPDDDALAFLAQRLETAPEPHRVVLMHIPPHFGGRYAPHPEWGFSVREPAFLELVRRHQVGLVCCAHALLFDHHVEHGTRFVVSGGGGTALCSHLRGVCAGGPGHPEDRGALFHAVEITVTEAGAISGRVLQAFDPVDGYARLGFGGHSGT